MSFNRREFIKTLTSASVIVPLTACAAPSGGKSGGGKARVVVVGGGFGGATAAKPAPSESINPLHPCFLVYVLDDGNVRFGFTHPKQSCDFFCCFAFSN